MAEKPYKPTLQKSGCGPRASPLTLLLLGDVYCTVRKKDAQIHAGLSRAERRCNELTTSSGPAYSTSELSPVDTSMISPRSSHPRRAGWSQLCHCRAALGEHVFAAWRHSTHECRPLNCTKQAILLTPYSLLLTLIGKLALVPLPGCASPVLAGRPPLEG